MRAVRISAPESDREDYEAIVTAARLFYVEGLTQEKWPRNWVSHKVPCRGCWREPGAKGL